MDIAAGMIHSIFTGDFHCLFKNSDETAMVERVHRTGVIEEYELYTLIGELGAAHTYNKNIPELLGVKVGCGVLVNDDLMKLIIEKQQDLLDTIYTVHHVKMFSKCTCQVKSKTLFGQHPCRSTVQRYLLLGELFNSDVASIIRENLLS